MPHPRVDPKTLIDTETVTVRAGTLTTKHYRYVTRYGEPVDVWMADAVWPIGLVRLQAQMTVNLHPAVLVYELIARGDHAEPRITLPATPSEPPK